MALPMSSLAFTQVSLLQQETIAGGGLKGIKEITINNYVNTFIDIRFNILTLVNIGKDNTIFVNQNIA
jgi:uncharacterized membrane-anchored protein YitT (DUF2179 family)